MSTTIVFVLEMISKVMAFGFIFNGKSSYLRSSWNIMDLTIIIFSVLSLTPLTDTLRTFKIFRIFRLLRLISRNEELKVALRALFLALPNVANVTIIMLLFFLIFGVIAVSYFKGKLFYCEEANIDLTETVNTKWDCLSSGGDWLNSIYTFDNAPNALVTLFVMATTSGWADLMLSCATSTDIDKVAGPRDSASYFWIIYFIVFIIVGAFFFLLDRPRPFLPLQACIQMPRMEAQHPQQLANLKETLPPSPSHGHRDRPGLPQSRGAGDHEHEAAPDPGRMETALQQCIRADRNSRLLSSPA